MKKRIKGIIGYGLVIFGLLLPLIGFLPMTINNLKAEKSYNDYIERQSQLERGEKLQADINAYNEDIKKQENLTAVDPFTVEGYQGIYELEDRDSDEIFSYLVIPKIDLIRPIYLDASEDHLAKGIAQVDKTALPIGGKGTRSVLAGHRDWYNDVMFLNLDDLENGDLFFIDNGKDIISYKVFAKEIIGPSDWEKLKADPDKDLVTLLTCHPMRPPSPYRLLVHGERVDKEKDGVVESTGRDIAEENALANAMEIGTAEKTKRINTLLYGVTLILSLALIWALVKFVKYIRNI